jgi:hypothetical protein
MMKLRKTFAVVASLWVMLTGCQTAKLAAHAASAISNTTYTFASPADGKAFVGDWKLDSDGTILQSSVTNSFPLLVFNAPVFKDFDYAAEFKIESSVADQFAALTFRIVDQKNYYTVRASANEQSVTFAWFDEGSRSVLKTWSAAVKQGDWQTLSVRLRGADVAIMLNGLEVGKVGLGTKADSIARFRKVMALAK